MTGERDKKAGNERSSAGRSWVFVAAGLLFLAASSAALSALGAQLGMMHPAGGEGYGPQGFSTSHLEDAVSSWKAFWDATPSDLQTFASGEEVARTWYWTDLAVFIPAYAIAGLVALRRAARRRKASLGKDDRLAKTLRLAWWALAAMVLLDVAENSFSLAALGALWDGEGSGFVGLVAGLTITKTAVGAFVVGVVLLSAVHAFANRSEGARETGRLLRGQIGIAVVTAVLFLVPVQLPDIFLRLDGWQTGALVASGALLAVSTWAVGRWIVVRRESRPNQETLLRIPPAALVVPLLLLGGLAILNCATGGSWVGPLVPVGIAVAAFVSGLAFDRKAQPERMTDLGRLAVVLPHVLSVTGLTFAAGAAIKAEAARSVATDGVGDLWVFLVTVVVIVVLIGRALYLADHLLSGKRVFTLSAKPASLLTKPTDSASPTRSRRYGGVVGVAAALVVASTWLLLAARVAGSQRVGAGTAVFLFFSALTLIAGTAVTAADTWVARHGLPRLFSALSLRAVPVFSLILIWGLVGAKADDGAHWDVRKLEDAPAASATTLDAAFEEWTAQPRTVEPGRKPVPLVIVSASGGGIRAAYWTALTLDCVFDGRAAAEWNDPHPCEAEGTPPTPSDVFLASGISGSSLGLVEWDASREEGLDAGWVSERLGHDFVAPTVAWGLLVEVPRSFLHFVADDRAEVLEESWERPWTSGDANAMAEGFLASQEQRTGPLLMLNGSSVLDGCTLNVSLLDEGARSIEELPLKDCTVVQPLGEVPAGEPEGVLPLTADVVDYLRCGADHDIRRSTAALLSARFPYVSSAGRLAACTSKESTKYIVDGGYLDTSAADPAVASYLAVEPLIERYNASEERHCIVPYFLQIDNGYLDPRTPPRAADPPNQLVAPLQMLWGSTGLTSRGERARTLAAELFTHDFATAPGSDADVVEEPRYELIVPRRHPGIEAPLGWALSEDSQADLRSQLYRENADRIRTVQGWFDDPEPCAPLPAQNGRR